METAVIGVTVAPLLAARSKTAEQVTQALLGAPLTLLEPTPRWVRVRMDDEYEGWISRSHLAPPFAEAREQVAITDLWVNLRPRPDYRMPVRQVACIGTRLPLAERQPGWLAVALPAGGIGWLEEQRGRIGAPDEPCSPPEPAALLTTARRFMGVPYLWGGCSPFGLDCSGFVQLVYRLHGILLPRDADQQAQMGVPIPVRAADVDQRRGLAPGDAVFFGAAEEPGRITHVGLALGDGAFIHAAGSDQVRVNGLDDPPYGERLVRACRYLPG